MEAERQRKAKEDAEKAKQEAERKAAKEKADKAV